MGRIFLNPEQLALLATKNSRQLIVGEYGTGKSLVLKMLAEELADEYDIFVISCTNVSHTRTMGRLRRSENHLVEHIHDLLSDATKGEARQDIRVWSLCELVRYCFPQTDPFGYRLSPRLIADVARCITGMLYPRRQIALLLDEVPFVPSWDWRPLEEFCLENREFILWMTIATGTYAIRDSADPVSVVAAKSPKGFLVAHLTRCMRMTRSGLRFYKALQEHLGDKAHLFMEYGNAIDGLIPRWYELSHCVCGTADPFACRCVGNRMDGTLRELWDQLVNIKASHVTFVVRDSVRDTDRFLSSLLVESCHRLNIPLRSFLSTSRAQSDPSGSSALSREAGGCCRLVDIFSFKGCESPVVIFVTPFGWPLVWEHENGRHGWDDISPQISRALGQIILITWPRDETNFFSLQAVKGTIESYSQNYEGGDEHESEFVSVMKSNLQKVVETYQGRDGTGYLDVLVEQGVLVKIPTNSTDAGGTVS